MSSSQDCQRRSVWCNDENVKLCQMKSSSGGVTGGGNTYEGRLIWMCAQCRKLENGQFKFVKQS